ncbi:MAG TPA: PepSY-associated TM helix domain-containing protein, partial [Gammaproteobacteria bacterium]|nr:PepSY-associated TM helix domain-containing protein [Gammaproteobacteria bacterium]
MGSDPIFSARTPAPRRGDWLDRPQQRPFRKLLFQIHLWLGIATGLYVVVISVSGSAAVFRREANRWLVPQRVEVIDGARLSTADLAAAARALYPGYDVARVGEPVRRDRPVLVELRRPGQSNVSKERLFDPYTGRDLGNSYPALLRAVEWAVRLHDDLLGGIVGRRVNGIGGALVLGLAATGAVIWWPGRRRWVASVVPKRGVNAPRIVWQLHSVVGLWSFVLLALWAATGVYFAFPEPFEALIDAFDDDPSDFYRPGEAALLGMIKLHFGRFGGLGIRVLWTVLGLLPAVLFVTGFMVWWRRVVRKRLRAGGAAAAALAEPAAPAAAVAIAVPITVEPNDSVAVRDDRRPWRDSSEAPAP